MTMMMHRRSFLAGASASLLGLGLGLRPRAAHAEEAPYEGPFWVFVHASGGWDPQFMFDPKSRVEHNRLYTEIGMVGNIPYAGWELDPQTMGLDSNFDYTGLLYTPRSFLEKFGDKLTVINGVDTTTNNHDSGTRAMASGRLTEGYPALGALVATLGGNKMPLAFLAGGGYDATMGLVPAVRLNNLDIIKRIAEPNKLNPSDANSKDTFHTEATWQRIRALQGERLARLRETQYLPALSAAMDDLKNGRLSDADLKKLVIPQPVNIGGNLGGLEGSMRQAQLAIAAFKSGLAISAGLRVGGFDTHGDHDRNHPRQLAQLFGAVGYVLEEVARAGLEDRTYVVVTSDFGRGPSYNGSGAGAGKDHWPITSVLAFGPNVQGNRVVGKTDDDQRAVALHPDTLEPAEGGVVINAEHVHVALRRLVGMDDGNLAREYPLAAAALPLFG